MKKENKSMAIGFEIVALAGDARSIYLKCLSKLHTITSKNVDSVIKSINNDMKEAEELLNECHVKQTDILQGEARGEFSDFSFLMVHAQDHLMTTILLKEMMQTFIDVYKRIK